MTLLKSQNLCLYTKKSISDVEDIIDSRFVDDKMHYIILDEVQLVKSSRMYSQSGESGDGGEDVDSGLYRSDIRQEH